MNQLTSSQRVRVISALLEGNSIASTCRMTGVAKRTVLRLLAEMGVLCADHHHQTVRGLRPQRVQCDEIWSFCYARDKNVPSHLRDQPGIGSVWTWVGMDADTKLCIGWLIGDRDAECAREFMLDLASRIVSRVQLTTDGHQPYLQAVDDAFGKEVDYAMLVKIYGKPRARDGRPRSHDFVGAKRQHVTGFPNGEFVSTSFIERQNLTMRMSMRRFTRRTNAFSKKLANLRHSVALHYANYNFCRIHQSLRVTPAMAAGLSDHVWSLDELVGLLVADEQKAIANGALKRGAYRPRISK